METLLRIAGLLRIKNLFLVLITMILLQGCIINNLLGVEFMQGGMSFLEFSLLIISTLLITAGGYIINDINDINSDTVNKPGKNVVGIFLSERTAEILYWITTSTGVTLGIIVSYLINQINFGFIFILSTGLLWFYSRKYSCQPLVGNIVIAILTAISFALIWLFEFYALSNRPIIFTEVQTSFKLVNRIVLIYAGFAFLVSLIRELVKDIEDFTGDNRFGCRTFPVVFGISAAKLLTLILTLALFALLITVQYYFINAGFMYQFYWFIIIDLLTVLSFISIFRAIEKKQWSRISMITKIIMFTGVLSMGLFLFN